MGVVRSDGWTVRPSFAPHGPTSPVTLLFDDEGVTQLAGMPAVVWQTPWSEVSLLRVTRRGRGAAIVAVVADTPYVWRHGGPLTGARWDELRSLVVAHGGRELARSRRVGALVVAAVVTLASFGGYLASRWVSAPTSPTLSALEGVNLNARDVAGTWATTTTAGTSDLQAILPAPGQVLTWDPATTMPAPDTAFSLAGNHFQRCLGVPSVDDRVYGAAGQVPRYAVSSPVFSTSSHGGIEVESLVQYYDSPRSVASDVAEMSRGAFGRCFAEANADLLIGRTSSVTPDLTTGVNLSEHPFVKGWVRAGAVAVALANIGITRATLVVVSEAAGHYEATLVALVNDLAAARATVDDLVNSMLVRVTSTSAVST